MIPLPHWDSIVVGLLGAAAASRWLTLRTQRRAREKAAAAAAAAAGTTPVDNAPYRQLTPPELPAMVEMDETEASIDELQEEAKRIRFARERYHTALRAIAAMPYYQIVDRNLNSIAAAALTDTPPPIDCGADANHDTLMAYVREQQVLMFRNVEVLETIFAACKPGDSVVETIRIVAMHALAAD